ncbi:hypothetical protein B0H12DRAFT_694677 [Mycena haematopus]|nr:hypothetical protein B0H12DRAFT_694677 [Mycena haematopus]
MLVGSFTPSSSRNGCAKRLAGPAGRVQPMPMRMVAAGPDKTSGRSPKATRTTRSSRTTTHTCRGGDGGTFDSLRADSWLMFMMHPCRAMMMIMRSSVLSPSLYWCREPPRGLEGESPVIRQHPLVLPGAGLSPFCVPFRTRLSVSPPLDLEVSGTQSVTVGHDPSETLFCCQNHLVLYKYHDL